MPRHGHTVICRVGFSFLAHFLTVLTTHTNTITPIKKQDGTVCGNWSARDTGFLPLAFLLASRVVAEVCLRRVFPTSSYVGVNDSLDLLIKWGTHLMSCEWAWELPRHLMVFENPPLASLRRVLVSLHQSPVPHQFVRWEAGKKRCGWATGWAHSEAFAPLGISMAW